jgi:hypothetical protein
LDHQDLALGKRYLNTSTAHCSISDNLLATLCPKPKPDTQQTSPKGYQNGGSQPTGLTSQPSPMQTKLHPTFVGKYSNCNRDDNQTTGFSQNGSGHIPCHHRTRGLIWTRFLLMDGVRGGKMYKHDPPSCPNMSIMRELQARLE